jgi:hypothetical protein
MTTITLRRRFRHSPYRDVIGAVCQYQRPWESEPCGGELLVEDHGSGSDRMNDGEPSAEHRYELFCDRCKECDCNGYRTLAEVREAAKTFGQLTMGGNP